MKCLKCQGEKIKGQHGAEFKNPALCNRNKHGSFVQADGLRGVWKFIEGHAREKEDIEAYLGIRDGHPFQTDEDND
jgi:hypothetical protein